MINVSSSSRRILTFPAVQPCPSASPSTLLRSLADIAADIYALRSLRFPVLRAGVREAFREVGIILAFLDDVSDLPDSAAVGFSELHVALQKLRHLLSDCGRRGARLWILMNSDRVSSDLRAIVRAVSTALDVLPLDYVEADHEVKEMVRLLARQSWEVDVEIDRDDGRMMRAVRSILRQFQSGVSPDPTDLRRVLDRLDITNWAGCNDEILFLEEEMAEVSKEEDGRDSALLGSLMGFLIYSRAILFETDADAPKTSPRKQSQFREKAAEFIKPESLRCPISLELMTDPVTISTGQTYDRSSITRWFKDGLSTCPVTGETLTDTIIVPNSAIHNIIRDYCCHHNILLPLADASSNGDRKRGHAKKTVYPRGSAAAEATRMTVVFLAGKLSAGSLEEKNRAAYEIRLLSKWSHFHRACLVEADCVPWLLHVLSSSDPSIQDNAVAALLNISKHPCGRTAIFDVGGLCLVVDAVTEGLKVEVQQNAAAILFYLSSVDEYRQEVGAIPDAIPALVSLLQKDTYRGKKNAILAIFGLLMFPGNHQKILAAGLIPAIAGLLADEREDLLNDCVGVLAKIAEGKEGSRAILRSSPDVLPRLVQVLQSTTTRSGREHSVSLMLALCNNGGPKVVGQLESMPSLMPSLYSIIAGGHPQASKKARSLVNHIHQMYDQDYPVPAMAPAVQDSSVHALY